MKILVVDLETTGLSKINDAIVEIGMVLVDTKTKEIKKVFDNVVKHDKFDPDKHANAWIFKNSSLNIFDVMNAKNLEDYREEIQNLLDKYKMTAFNKPFDIKFLEQAGFKLTSVDCLMQACRKYSQKLDKRGARKTPSVEEIYNLFFIKDGEEYIEEHRAGQDAIDEAKIMLQLVEYKKNPPKDLLVIKEKKKKPNFEPMEQILDINDKFPFGKFKDKLVSEVVKTSPNYLNWCLNNVNGFKITDKVKELL
jgi:DNA polymerase III alpha subunit (gram-positive type)